MPIDIKSCINFNEINSSDNEPVPISIEPYRITGSGGVTQIYAVNRQWPIEKRRNLYYMIQVAQSISRTVNKSTFQSTRRINIKQGPKLIVSIFGDNLEWAERTEEHKEKYDEAKLRELPIQNILLEFLPKLQYYLRCNKRVAGLNYINTGISDELRSSPDFMLSAAIKISNASPGAEVKIFLEHLEIAAVVRGFVTWYHKDKFPIKETEPTTTELKANLEDYLKDGLNGINIKLPAHLKDK